MDMLGALVRPGQEKLVHGMYKVLGSALRMVTSMTDKVPNDRFNLQPETLQDLQESLYNWQKYNFGDQDNERMLLGVFEESGELCHAQLKLEQGIRGSIEKHEADMRDAIGDVMIYLLNYMSGLGEKIMNFLPLDSVKKTDDRVEIRKAVMTVYRVSGRVEDNNGIQHLVSSLIYLCALKGWDLEEITRETWAKIGRRDWREHPETGFPAQDPTTTHNHMAQSQAQASQNKQSTPQDPSTRIPGA